MRVESLVQEFRNQGETVEVVKREKNGCQLTGIAIGTGAVKAVIYAEYLNWNETDAELVRAIKERIKEENMAECESDFRQFTVWEYAKKNVIPCLRKVTNDKALVIPFLDLQIYFRTIMEFPGKVVSTIITKDSIKLFGISEEELQKQAFENVKNSYEISNMENPDDLNGDMLVVTNKNAYYGASAICDKEVLKIIAEQIGGNYYIIPSSIHEVMILSTEFLYTEEIDALIRSANAMVCDAEEQLSDHVYIYKKDEGTIVYGKEVN